jgi:hypothetical protein
MYFCLLCAFTDCLVNMKTFEFEFDGKKYGIIFSHDVQDREAFRQAMTSKLGTGHHGRLANAYCHVFKVTKQQYIDDCRRCPIRLKEYTSPDQRASIMYEEDLQQDVAGQKRKHSSLVPKHPNPNHKRDEYLKKRREENKLTNLGLSAAAITIAYTSSINQYRIVKTMCNVMLKNAGSSVRLPPEQKVRDNGKQIYEQEVAGIESSNFLAPKMYQIASKTVGFTRIIGGVQFGASETITITNLFPKDLPDMHEALSNIGITPKAFEFQEHNISAKIGFNNKKEMQEASKVLKGCDSVVFRVWEGREHRMVVDICADLVDAVSLLILSAGTVKLDALADDVTVFLLLWQDNRTASTHCKIRLLDDRKALFDAGQSQVSNLLSFVGGENRLPKFMRFAIEQFDTFLSSIFCYNKIRINIKIKFNVADHHASYTVYRKPGGASSFRDCFGVVDVNLSDKHMHGLSIFSMSKLNHSTHYNHLFLT